MDELRPDEVRADAERVARTGVPEVVFGEGKSPEQCARAAAMLVALGSSPVIVSRVDARQAAAVLAALPDATYQDRARMVVALPASGVDALAGSVAIVCAGTSDLPVAYECNSVLEAFGLRPMLVADVGVAGLHRLLALRDDLETVDVVIAVAGMEGALPTVVNGLVSPPVIAVPTSVGYGVGLDGLAALTGMLSSCTPGLLVVNIDNGVGAAMAAVKILRGHARREDAER